ncbi:MAG: DinB family protein [Acidobacteria bacterium]|nr:DinB family protein [Acidobacteriota bacterium]
MKRAVCVAMLVCSFSMLPAQESSPAKAAAKPSAQGPAKPAAAPTVARVLDLEISIIEREFVGAAEAMPEDKYSFTPESLGMAGSDFKGVRTFAAQAKHVATVNYMMWGAITGDAMPANIKDEDGPADMTSKADIVKFVKDSFALGHKAAAMITAENSMKTAKIPIFPNPVSRLFLCTFAVQHVNDHYGQMVEYLRMNGLVPPASRQQ